MYMYLRIWQMPQYFWHPILAFSVSEQMSTVAASKGHDDSWSTQDDWMIEDVVAPVEN
jgi:hypothetical protein